MFVFVEDLCLESPLGSYSNYENNIGGWYILIDCNHKNIGVVILGLGFQNTRWFMKLVGINNIYFTVVKHFL